MTNRRPTAIQTPAERQARREAVATAEAEAETITAAYVAGDLDRPTWITSMARIHAVYGPGCVCMGCREVAAR